MKRFLLTIAFLFCAVTASASEYHFEAGYYYKNGTAYTRTSYDYGAYHYDRYKCGYVWYPDVRYEYYPVNLDVTAADFESQLLAIAAGRDKVEGKLRLQAQTHQIRLELIDKLGMQGNFRLENYGVGSAYMIRQYPGVFPQVASYGVSGNTVYGVPVGTLSYTDWYSQFDANIAAQQSAMLAKGAQDYAITANTGFNQLASLFAEGSSKAAQIIAQGISAKMTLEASKAASQGTSIQQNVTIAPQEVPQFKIATTFTVANKCVNCHTGNKPQGNFDISKWQSFTQEQKDAIIASQLMTGKMPRGEDNKGHRLTNKEIAEFMKN